VTDRHSRAMVLERPGVFREASYPLPEPRDEEFLLRVERVTICGGDLIEVDGLNRKAHYPLLLGHEVVGRIEALGSAAAARRGLRVGSRVMVEPYISCGVCEFCTIGAYHFCREGLVYGVTVPCTRPPHLWGAYSEYLYGAPGAHVHAIDEMVPAEAACLTSVVANGVRWVRTRGRGQVGEAILVLGLGVQGLATVIAAREAGLGPIVAAARRRNVRKLELAKRYGAHVILDVEAPDICEQIAESLSGQPLPLVVIEQDQPEPEPSGPGDAGGNLLASPTLKPGLTQPRPAADPRARARAPRPRPPPRPARRPARCRGRGRTARSRPGARHRARRSDREQPALSGRADGHPYFPALRGAGGDRAIQGGSGRRYPRCAGSLAVSGSPGHRPGHMMTLERLDADRAVGTICVPSLVDVVTAELRRLVLSGALRPGERLVEERLTEQFGVSRPPVREAMRLLEQEGLITRHRRRGAYVTALTAEDVREIYVLRAALERLAVELGVPVVDPLRLLPPRAALQEMRRAADGGDRQRLLEANLQFHQALCALSGNRRLLQIYESLLRQSRLCMALNIRVRERQFGNLTENVERHATLLALIEAADRSAVLAALAVHGDRSFVEELNGDGTDAILQV